MLTNYPYLSKEWKENCDRERLLGVSLTGQWDCPTVRMAEALQELQGVAVRINEEYAIRFGINRSTAVTCGKPSGTLSSLVHCAAGGHAQYAPFYKRRVQINRSDPLFLMLKDQKLPYFPAPGFTYDNATTFLFEFPVKAPEGSVCRKDLSALQQLEHCKTSFTEHNPSVTIDVADYEWGNVQNWIRENWEIVGGLSFFPRDDTIYPMAPYEEITEEQYNEMLKVFAAVDYAKIVTYEKDDRTEGSKEFACVGGACALP
jgi:hypothetical protein